MQITADEKIYLRWKNVKMAKFVVLAAALIFTLLIT